jgi:hypothetical protein
MSHRRFFTASPAASSPGPPPHARFLDVIFQLVFSLRADTPVRSPTTSEESLEICFGQLTLLAQIKNGFDAISPLQPLARITNGFILHPSQIAGT